MSELKELVRQLQARIEVLEVRLQTIINNYPQLSPTYWPYYPPTFTAAACASPVTFSVTGVVL